ncbi:Na/Pi cotransporter family protein [Oceanidesulfovibrio marinus]|uniref:Na/Pi cotransporter family protein n=1 Tax=Oceanidesulfovibrio marinus TaxID=370038 RepID=A0A6P1ZDY2_9BACT|nr:Na/Pi symporter [Oceanidesulfovibrio marinus]TVM32036.1 Na/Pi cotransporter family protein [Oceanidesulfovibrio marinus]
MNTGTVINLLGGLGLLLLGMKLMTDGLRLAGGPLLRDLLSNWTRTRLRGLLSGFGLTSLVQSSSAVTVAAIGFVNAGLMTMPEAVWVVYGSNVGTTTTAWIVAFLGLKIKIKALALPFIAVGTGLWISGTVSRRASLGEALAGFGLFFLGVEVMQSAFTGLGPQLALHSGGAPGIAGLALFVGIGFVLTLAMQSSSASLVLVLTAAAGGTIGLEAAAAAIIGANVGTTSTAVFAVIGATPSAKRLAVIHVVFKVITGIIAFLILGPMLAVIVWGRKVVGFAGEPAAILALYHTCFNVLGVMVLWPLTRPLTRFVSKRFKTAEEDESAPKYLDDTVVRTPALAVNALVLELGRIAGIARRMALSAIVCSLGPCPENSREMRVLESLQLKAGKFIGKLTQEGLGQDIADALPRFLRAAQYFRVVGELATEEEQLRAGMQPIPKGEVAKRIDELRRKAAAVVEFGDPEEEGFTPAKLRGLQQEFENDYQEVKQLILNAGTDGRLAVTTMTQLLELNSRIRRLVGQSVKGALMLARLRSRLPFVPPETAAE